MDFIYCTCSSGQVDPAGTVKERRTAHHFSGRGHICFLTCTDVYGPWEPACAAGHYTLVHSSCCSSSTLRHWCSSSLLQNNVKWCSDAPAKEAFARWCSSVMFHVLGSSKSPTCPLSQELTGQVFAFCVWTTGTNQRLAPPKQLNY